METKIFKCGTCGKMAEVLRDSDSPLVCCGKPMTEMVPGTTDGAVEKHVPVVEIDGKTVVVKVGSVTHPMEEAHHIEWISIETKEGSQRKWLKPGDKPEAVFVLSDSDEFVSALESCNLHGLWKKDLKE